MSCSYFHEYVLNVVMDITELCFVVITGRSVCGTFLSRMLMKGAVCYGYNKRQFSKMTKRLIYGMYRKCYDVIFIATL